MMLNASVKRSFKKHLAEGQPQLGTFVKINSPEMIELLGMAGFDFIIIDMEHTTLAFHQVEQMVRVADLHRMSTIIRLPDSSRSSILRALDLGASGIQVPQIDNVNEVKEIVDKSKYHPQGSRGLTFAHRAAKFGNTPKDYLEEENLATTVAVHIETVGAFEDVEAICTVDGLDVVFIGPLDLSVSLELEANYIDGSLADPVKRIVDACRENHKIPGIAVSNVEQYQFALNKGIPYIVWSSDVALFKQAIDSVIQLTREN
ncbi:HpcH/HpaI aldolase/citrate lyase family protein [Psychrobacillus sp. NPDC093180]|uniref:HpcH/HpaI aldolase family protein n=1 Tax=Psychrobacillus sp. NPDC093180 TaxID=3364489 RepID=UPI0037F480E1